MSGIRIGDEFIKKFGKKFPPEAFLAKEGESGATMFIIAGGKVAVMKQTAAGEKMIATLVEGDFFGEMAIMGLQDTRGASVKTLAETTVLELSREAFEGLIRKSPEIAISVIRTLTERVRDANGKLSALIHKDDRIRISTFLVHNLNVKGSNPVATVNPVGKCLPLKPKELASNLGISNEAVESFLTLAKKSKILAQNGEWIYVPQISYLMPFAEYLVKNSKG